MALITSYSSLISTVQSYLARSDLASDAPTFVQLWEERFYRQPKNHGRWMEQQLSGIISAGAIPVPNDYLNLKNVYRSGSPSSRIEFVSLEQLLGKYPRGDWQGTPVWMARERTSFIFGPVSDSAYTILGTYWAKPARMRDYPADAVSHWIIVNAPDLALYGALLEAESFLKNDSRLITWKSFYNDAVSDYRDLTNCESNTMYSQEVLA